MSCTDSLSGTQTPIIWYEEICDGTRIPQCHLQKLIKENEHLVNINVFTQMQDEVFP